MDFDEHDDPEDEMAEMAGPQGGYDSLTGSRPQRTMGSTPSGGGGDGGSVGVRKPSSVQVRYRECLKNHALSLGGSAVDGCGEFMAAGDEGTLDALRCAACNCHRNFHRKETDGEGGVSSVGNIYYHHQQAAPPQYHHHHNHFSAAYYRAAPPPSGYLHLTPPAPRPLALPAASGGYSREDEDVSNPSSSGGAAAGAFRKRHRTKFTAEQKEKMLALAESLGWRIQKHDEAAVDQFCEETGVKRHVLKVWMHNNKHNLGKKQPGSSTDDH